MSKDSRMCLGCKHSRRDPNGFGQWCGLLKDWCRDRNRQGMCKYYKNRNKIKKVENEKERTR